MPNLITTSENVKNISRSPFRSSLQRVLGQLPQNSLQRVTKRRPTSVFLTFRLVMKKATK